MQAKIGRRELLFILSALVFTPLAPILYILSIGPAFRMFYKQQISTETFLLLYEPVMDLACEWGFTLWLSRYMAWCGK